MNMRWVLIDNPCNAGYFKQTRPILELASSTIEFNQYASEQTDIRPSRNMQVAKL
jgi:hypothetical protein